ncbi:MAG: DUF819 family protein [Pseudomonadota bacterium]|nr:DUF819 family protein [Pseudomonadota bacterium]
MITDGFAYVALLLFIAGGLKALESRVGGKFFEFVPAIVLLYGLVMGVASLGVWEASESVNAVYAGLKDNLLPAMIFLMLLKSDLRRIRKLGAKMILAFAVAALSISAAFVMAFSLFKSLLPADAWKTFAALSGSWMGGTGNMVAIQGALDVDESSMGYALLVDSLDYALWVVILLALVPYAKYFNRWSGADSRLLEDIGASLEADAVPDAPGGTRAFSNLIFLLGASLVVSALCQAAADRLPTSVFLTGTAWTVLIATAAGVAAAMSPLGRLSESELLASLMLYTIVALIASRADFAALNQAPLYVVVGLTILLIHGLIMVAAAKVFKLDLFACGVASLANIGGVASAPILAAAYSRHLIPVGVLMAMLGYIIGTGGGLLVGKILSVISG